MILDIKDICLMKEKERKTLTVRIIINIENIFNINVDIAIRLFNNS